MRHNWRYRRTKCTMGRSRTGSYVVPRRRRYAKLVVRLCDETGLPISISSCARADEMGMSAGTEVVADGRSTWAQRSISWTGITWELNVWGGKLVRNIGTRPR